MSWADDIELVDRAVQDHLGGESILYAPAVGSPVTVAGVFDEVYVRLDGDSSTVGTVGPAVLLVLSDLPTDPELDAGPVLTIRGRTYKPRAFLRDGLGSIRLPLHVFGP